MAAVSAAKEAILKRIRQALSNPVPLPFPDSEGIQSVYQPQQEDDAIVFAEEFTKLQGKFAFCVDETDLQQQFAALVHEKGWKNIYYRKQRLQTKGSSWWPAQGASF